MDKLEPNSGIVSEPVQKETAIAELAETAAAIWREYYTPLLGEEQVTYMLTHIQSEATIAEDIHSGKLNYFLIRLDGEPAGYYAYSLREKDLFLSKLYLKQETRGRKVAYRILRELMEVGKREQKACLTLTVNKYNTASIRFYEQAGFRRTEAVVSPIGGGFVMDDYVYQLPLG